MPPGKFSKKNQGSTFGKIVDSSIEDAKQLLNAIDFIESPQGLNVRLYPVQRLIVKAIFGVPFDYKEGKIDMWDDLRKEKIRTVTESEYLHIAHEEGRGNINDWRDIPERGFNEAAVFAGRRGGKAIGVDELIPTPSGFVKNGALKTGDTVLSPSGDTVRVVAAHPPFLSKTYRVTFDDGSSVVTHPGHLWLTYSRSERRKLLRRPRKVPVKQGECHCGCGNPSAVGRKFKHGHHALEPNTGTIRTTEEIKATLLTSSKLQANHAVPLPSAVNLPEKELLLDPYCLGVWLGDGNSDCGIITATDEDGIETLSYFTTAGFKWRKSEKKDYRWHVYGLPLTKLGVLHNKHIPEEYLWASKEQRLALLQGLMDTDGSCSRNRCEFTNTNRKLAEGVYHLAASLGLKPYWGEGRATIRGRDCGEKYRVTWTSSLPVFRLKRKLALLPTTTKDTQNWRYIVSVEPEKEEWVRCITVANEDGLFLFGKNFNVTHNSQVVSGIAAYSLYKLLNVRSPQEYFSLVPGSPIEFTFLAQDEEGAGRLFDKLSEDVNRAPFFNPYIKSSTATELTFVSEADRGKRDVTGTIGVKSYACIDENELIWTAEGLTPLKEVAADSQVLDVHAAIQTVSNHTVQIKDVLALETANFRGDPLLLTPDHTCLYVPYAEAREKLTYLIRKNGSDSISGRTRRKHGSIDYGVKLKEGFASELSVGDYLVFPQIPDDRRKDEPLDNSGAKRYNYSAVANGRAYTRLESSSRPVKCLPVNAVACRLYGLFLAEGSISGTTNPFGTVKWTFHINERHSFAEFVQQALLSEFGLPSSIVEESARNKCTVTCCSVELGRGLARWFGKGAKHKTIPTAALFWSRDNQQALIRGYLDGDGSDNRDIAGTVSKKLAYSLFALGVQAGLRPSVMSKPAYVDKKGLAHADSWIVEMCKTERHYRFYQQIDGQNYYWSKITELKNTGEKRRVVDIEVEDTHSFLTKLAAVHNCTTNSARGPSSIFLAFDEFAHFRSAKGSSSDEVYGAATPATANFHHAELKSGGWISAEQMDRLKNEGKSDTYNEFQDSLILSISSPWTKVGKMYELHDLALRKGVSSGIFTLRVSTADMNPTILSSQLVKEYTKNPLTFQAEFGGKFLESSESYVPESVIRKCTDVQYIEVNGRMEPDETSARFNTTRFHPDMIGRQFFWGIDLGMEHDGTAVAIGHLEYRGGVNAIHLIYDYIDRMMVGEKFEGPGVEQYPGDEKYVNYRALILDDIIKWLRTLNNLMPCFRGATDQHGGQQLVQTLQMNHIPNVELLNLNETINSQMAYALKGYMNNDMCRFPYVPKFMKEIRLVEETRINNYRIKVAAPAEKNAHDDMVDAAQLVAFLAQKWLMEEGGLGIDPSGISIAIQAQMYKPSAPIINLDGVPMSDLRIRERLKKFQQNMGGFDSSPVRNPYHKRGR